MSGISFFSSNNTPQQSKLQYEFSIPILQFYFPLLFSIVYILSYFRIFSMELDKKREFRNLPLNPLKLLEYYQALATTFTGIIELIWLLHISSLQRTAPGHISLLLIYHLRESSNLGSDPKWNNIFFTGFISIMASVNSIFEFVFCLVFFPHKIQSVSS